VRDGGSESGRPGPAAAAHPLPEGQSGNPGGRRTKSLLALSADALNETMVIDDRRTAPHDHQARGDRDANGRQSASADLRATKMLIDMMKDVERRAGDTAPPPEPRRLAAADKEVVQLFVARLRRQILQEIEEARAAELPE